MATLGVIGLIVAIAFMIFGAYKGLGALPLTIISALIVILFNRMPLWDSIANFYVGGYVGIYTNFLLIFISSTLYAKVMNETGCVTAIGYKLVSWFGKSNAILVSILICAILTYGGVSIFVVVLAACPIMFAIFKEADLPRHLTLGCLGLGGGTFTMTALAGTPQATNIIPTRFLGTSLTAAPILGILCAAGIFAFGYIYLKREEKKAVARGEHFEFPEGFDASQYLIDHETLPAAWKSFVPPIVLIAFIIIGSRFINNSTMISVLAMLIGTALAAVLNMDKLKGKDAKKILSTGLTDGIGAIGGLAAVVAFGTVVQNSVGFEVIAKAVLNLDLNIYMKGIVSTAVISGITGSSSGGLNIMLNSMSEYFINSGCNLDILHRLCAVAAGSLDSLPHSSAIFLMMSALGLTHKEAYKHTLWTTVIGPAIVAIAATLVVMAIGF